ncbi:MAG: nucleotidyltransferase domain-containing protein [Firmicutes bacterium]|nr:nucleotidyltransferase domain-containing protein [Bacillota bacterium]
MSQQIKTVRENLGFTQEMVSTLTGIPVKTIRNWEQEIRKPSDWAVDLLIDRMLREKNEQTQTIDETTGVLSFLTMKKIVQQVAKDYDVDHIYLFGSYAKGEATEYSDVDLYMESSLFGLKYFEFIENLREKLSKKVELLSNMTIKESSRIEEEIKKTGVLLYER